MSRFLKYKLLWLLFFSVSLTACFPDTADLVPSAIPPTTSATIGTDSVPTAVPPKTLREMTICLGQEPNTLYINDNPNPSALSVLEAIYDGPLDSREYGYQPVILQKVPSFADGSASLVSVPVKKGDWVINATGKKIELVEGARIYPSGCKEKSCIATFKEDSTFQMDQMVVTFRFLPDLRWADGAPLTADDSVYAFDLALASKNPADEYLITHTESYEAEDVFSTTWRGLPGYRDNSYMNNFWQPLPYHIWSEFSATELVDSDVAARFPIGWGAYVVDEWIPQESITLIKNPLYYRAAEGLPKIDILNFRFIPDPNTALVALLDGECDLLDPSIPLDGQVALLQELDKAGKVKFYATEKISLENLYLGINADSTSPQPLSNPKTRQAFAFCLDRQKVVETVLHGLATVPDSYIPNGHPLYTPNLNIYSFSTTKGSDLLNEVGWRDLDNDPSTPRTAYNVPNIPVGTPLELDYITTTSLERRQASEILADSLRSCGIGINLHYLPTEKFYAPAPEGILFGRNFDLAQLAIGSESLIPRCDWFSTAAIPNATNDWGGENLSGYSNAMYDEACQIASFTFPGEPTFEKNYRETLAIYAEDLPAIPLYSYLSFSASRPDLCNFSLDPSAQTPLWQIEELDYGNCE